MPTASVAVKENSDNFPGNLAEQFYPALHFLFQKISNDPKKDVVMHCLHIFMKIGSLLVKHQTKMILKNTPLVTFL